MASIPETFKDDFIENLSVEFLQEYLDKDIDVIDQAKEIADDETMDGSVRDELNELFDLYYDLTTFDPACSHVLWLAKFWNN